MKKLSGKQVEKKALKYLKEKYPGAYIEGPPVRTKFQRRDYFAIFDYLVVFKNGDLMGVQVSKKYLSSKSKEFKKKWKDWSGSKLYLHWRKGEWQLNGIL